MYYKVSTQKENQQMSIRALDNFSKTEPLRIVTKHPATTFQPLYKGFDRVKTFSDVMDKSIQEFLQAGEMNPVAKIKFHKILDGALAQIMSPENYLNKGRDSKVFRISDKYVAKIRRGKTEDNAIRIYNVAKAPDKRFNQLGIYYGEPVIKVGNVEILKNATPNEYTPCGMVWLKANGKNADLQTGVKKYEQEYLPLCSSQPQESFDELADGLSQLNKISDGGLFSKKTFYTPDIQNPNNVLIADNHFRIVDDLDKTDIQQPNNIYTMLQPLMLRLTPDTPVEFEKGLVKDRKNILRKTMIAAEKADLPLVKNELIDPSADFYLNSITDNDYSSMIDLVGDMRAKGFNKKERLEFINNALLEK